MVVEESGQRRPFLNLDLRGLASTTSIRAVASDIDYPVRHVTTHDDFLANVRY
jgi:hypothetical protein